MGRFRKIKFQNICLLYSLCLVGIFLLAALLFILNIKVKVPEQVQGYYVDVDDAVLTEKGLMIPLNELEHRMVTEQEIHSLLIPHYVSVMTGTALAAFSASLLLSFVFAYILTSKIIKPIEKTANSLKNRKNGIHAVRTAFPKELSDIETAFMEVEMEVACLHTDFENLSSYISHEQKNSLALLRAMIQNECSNDAHRTTAQIDRMVKNLDDILTLSINQSQMEKVDLPLVCGRAVDDYKKACPAISFDFDEEADLYIAGNELLVYRAVSNLIDNAVKYGLGKPIQVYVGVQGNCPYVSVQDHGMGISMKQQEKIFESHYRIGNRKKDGYGIGLSLVRHVAEICGGFVWVESEKAKGSNFKLVFPAFTLD